jgi:hypothetical protein
LRLQRAAQERNAVGVRQPGRRRKGTVIDLDRRTIRRNRRRRFLMTLLVAEALIAVAALVVFVIYLTSGRASG